jgi:predicted transcriptional regulator
VPLDVCRDCSGCHEIAVDGTGTNGWIRCTPPAERRGSEHTLSVGDALREGVVAVEEDVRVRDVVALFVEKRLRIAVVIDQSGQVVGAVHESGLIPQIQARAHAPVGSDALCLGHSSIAASIVSEVMSSVRSIPEGMSLREALAEMAASRNQRLLAVDDEGRPVGVLVDVHALHSLRSENST